MAWALAGEPLPVHGISTTLLNLETLAVKDWSPHIRVRMVRFIDRNTPQSPLAAGPIPLKIGYDTGVKGSGGYTDIDIVLFRFADVYLSLAEGLCMHQGASTADLHEAIDNVNVVRNRAGLPNLS